jgi:acetyltransferase-like isoleucine patch superfamily enzyme
VIKLVAAALAAILPWKLKRLLYRLQGFEVDKTAHVGVSLLLVDHLRLGPGARIGNLNAILVDRLELDAEAEIRQLNAIRHCELVHLGEHAVIGGLNMVNGTGRESKYLQGVERTPALILGPHSCITYGHFFDTSDTIRLGPYAGVGGWGSQVLSHALDVHVAAQFTAPVEIGERAMTATAVVILPGSKLPPFSMLGANSLLNKPFEERYKLYGGTPATEVSELNPDMEWFTREVGEIP